MASKRGADALSDQSQTTANSSSKIQRTQAIAATIQPHDQRHVGNPSVLYLSIDYGTKNLPVAYRLGELDDDIRNIEMVRYSFKSPEAPQRAAWLLDGTFLWGYHVNDALKSGRIRRNDIVELWKLALYRDHKTCPTAKKVTSQLQRLGKGSVSDLIRIHLAAIIPETKERIRNQERKKHGRDIDVNSLPLRLFLNVPQLWSPPANRIMTQAAKAAGVDWVEVVYEAQSAVGYYAGYLKDSHPNALGTGDDLLVADLGGGIGDYTSEELLEGIEGGAAVKLRSLATLKGEFCGSQFVNENFLAWFTAKEEFPARCRRLGLSEFEVEKEADQQFDTLKRNFEGLHS